MTISRGVSPFTTNTSRSDTRFGRGSRNSSYSLRPVRLYSSSLEGKCTDFDRPSVLDLSPTDMRTSSGPFPSNPESTERDQTSVDTGLRFLDTLVTFILFRNSRNSRRAEERKGSHGRGRDKGLGTRRKPPRRLRSEPLRPKSPLVVKGARQDLLKIVDQLFCFVFFCFLSNGLLQSEQPRLHVKNFLHQNYGLG